jgi:hypothetical protein
VTVYVDFPLGVSVLHVDTLSGRSIYFCKCIEGVLDGTRRGGRRRKQLIDDLKEKTGYWTLKEEALDRTVCRSRFGKGYGPVPKQNTE